jgi:hypothetical protein
MRDLMHLKMNCNSLLKKYELENINKYFWKINAHNLYVHPFYKCAIRHYKSGRNNGWNSRN